MTPHYQIIETILGYTRDEAASLSKGELDTLVERLELIELAASMGTWRYRPSDGHVFWSPEVYRIHGVHPSNYQPDLETALTFYHEDDRGGVEKLLKTAVEKRRDFAFEARITLPDGEERYVKSHGRCSLNDKGELIELWGVFQDISDFKLQQKRYEAHKHYLEELVEARTRMLIEAKEKAETASESKSSFLMNISHELRTPMHAIISLSRIGKDKSEKWTEKERTENYRLIHESSQRLMKLINELLDLAKLESGKMHFRSEEYDLVLIARRVMAEMKPLLTEKTIACELKSSSDEMRAWCDKDKVEHVLFNLLSNAVKFTPEHKSIQIKLERTASEVLCHVIDEGIGIPDGEYESIFEKFIQSSKTTTGAGGTGLGLAICKEMVVGMGGMIYSKASRMGGAEFVFSLPRTASSGGIHE